MSNIIPTWQRSVGENWNQTLRMRICFFLTNSYSHLAGLWGENKNKNTVAFCYFWQSLSVKFLSPVVRFLCLPHMNSNMNDVRKKTSQLIIHGFLNTFWQCPKSCKMWSVGGQLVLLTALSRADIAADKPLVVNHSLVKAFPCIAPSKTMNCSAWLVSLAWSHGSLDLASHWHSLAAVSCSAVASLPQSRAAKVQLSIFPQSTDQLALKAIILFFCYLKTVQYGFVVELIAGS